MMSWWMQLKPRERLLLAGGGVFVLLLMIYSLLWEPFAGKPEQLRQQLKAARADVVWLQGAVQEVRQLQRGAGGGQRGGSLLGIIDQSAKRAQLGANMKRVEPDGSNRVRVWLEKAAFDDIAGWLEQLKKQHGLVIEQAVVDRDANEGRVSARLVFAGGA